MLVNVEHNAIISKGIGKNMLEAKELMIFLEKVADFERVLNVK